MATLAYTVPTTAKEDGNSWLTEQNLFVKNESPFVLYAQSNIYAIGMTTTVDREVKLVKKDVIGSTNRATNVATGTNVYGSTSDLWGDTWTPDDINDPQFGVAFAGATFTSPSTYGPTTAHLIAQGYNFNLPSTAVINGIQVRINGTNTSSGGGTARLDIDTIEVQITYTYDQKMYVTGRTSAFVHFDLPNPLAQVPDKQYRYQISDAAGNFIGEWSDVASLPKFKRDVNNLLSSMDIELGRTEKMAGRTNEDLNTELPELLTDEADGGLLAELIAALGLGSGTDADLNFNVNVVAIYGYYEELLTETDEILLTEDDESFAVANGYPEGRSIYQGYISQWQAQFGAGSENITLSSITHSNELKNIMMTTDDTSIVGFTTWDTVSSVGVSGAGPGDNTQMAQSFTMPASPATQLVSRISVKGRRWLGDVTVTAQLIVGLPGAGGAVLGTAIVPIVNTTDADISFAFADNITLNASTVYSIIFTANQSKTGGNVTYPFTVQAGILGFAGGDAYTYAAGAWVTQPYDMVFTVWAPGGNTTVDFGTIDPSNAVKRALDFAAARGSRVRYTSESIDNTGVPVPFKVQANTVAEVVDAANKLAPSDWYYYFDPGTNIVWFKKRPTTPTKFFTLGRDINMLTLKRSIEYLVNEVYFTGGGNPALFDKTVDAGKQAQWRRGLAKLSDNRVTSLTTSGIFSQTEINRKGDAIYLGDVTILAVQANFAIEDVNPGDLYGFVNFGNFIDQIALQIVSWTYEPDEPKAQLGTLLPSVPERVENLKRDLEAQAAENNPTSPS